MKSMKLLTLTLLTFIFITSCKKNELTREVAEKLIIQEFLLPQPEIREFPETLKAGRVYWQNVKRTREKTY